MKPVPLYDPSRADAAYQLRYSWSAWPSQGESPSKASGVFDSIRLAWEQDGLRLLEWRCAPNVMQLLFSAKPSVSPIHLAARAKGRLNHALRKAGVPARWNRKLAVRSIGNNTSQAVQRYIERQVGKERFVSPAFEATMREFTRRMPDVDLSLPTASARGRYWYNLHLVLVVERRDRISDPAQLEIILNSCIKAATRHEHRIARLAVMPDHLHLALRGNPTESPAQIAGCYQNNVAHVLGRKPIWSDAFYVGTFGEYTMDAVRQSADSR